MRLFTKFLCYCFVSTCIAKDIKYLEKYIETTEPGEQINPKEEMKIVAAKFGSENGRVARESNQSIQEKQIMRARCKLKKATAQAETTTESPEMNTASKITLKPPIKFMSNEVYTRSERNALDKFRPIVTPLIKRDYEKTDAHLIQWLRARNLDVQKAYHLYTEYLKWRKEQRIDGIVNEHITGFSTKPIIADGFDREGNPIVLISIAAFDLRRLATQGHLDKFYRYCIQMLERGTLRRRIASLKYGKEITQLTAIADFIGFSMRQHGCLACFPAFRDLFSAFENYYPGFLKHAIAINAPRAALPLLELMKPILSENTRKVLRVFGTNRPEWMQYLNTIIAPDQLPYRFGGRKN